QTVHKTYKEKLRPTPTQERALEDVLWRCRELYTTALEQRITAYQRRRVSVSRYGQEAELKDLRAEFPEYAGVRRSPLAYRTRCARSTRQDLSGVLPSHPMGREGRSSALQGAQPVSQLHLQAIWQRGAAGQGCLGPRQGAAAHRAPAPRLPPQGSSHVGDALRHDLLRRPAGPQHGAESPPRQEH